ncbi:hypothetical protein [Emticicia sp. W12TSBA100-4]
MEKEKEYRKVILEGRIQIRPFLWTKKSSNALSMRKLLLDPKNSKKP